jgi:hypothetical protein
MDQMLRPKFKGLAELEPQQTFYQDQNLEEAEALAL